MRSICAYILMKNKKKYNNSFSKVASFFYKANMLGRKKHNNNKITSCRKMKRIYIAT